MYNVHNHMQSILSINILSYCRIVQETVITAVNLMDVNYVHMCNAAILKIQTAVQNSVM